MMGYPWEWKQMMGDIITKNKLANKKYTWALVEANTINEVEGYGGRQNQ